MAKVDYRQLGPPETHGLLHTRPAESAFHTVTPLQVAVLVAAAAACVLYVVLGGFKAGVLGSRAVRLFVFVNFLFTLFYIVHSLYKLLLITMSARSARGPAATAGEIVVSEDEVAALDEAGLPVYTILVPLYRETESLAKLDASVFPRLSYVCLSTTLATNAVVEGRGQPVGLILMPYHEETARRIKTPLLGCIGARMNIHGVAIQH